VWIGAEAVPVILVISWGSSGFKREDMMFDLVRVGGLDSGCRWDRLTEDFVYGAGYVL
jgi:hypothetical protein